MSQASVANTGRLARVRCFLLDMDGTFYLGNRLIEGALRFIDTVRAQGRDFLFLTNNSSKDARQYAEKISRLGLPLGADKVLTSGAATAMHLRRQRPGARAFVVGTPALSRFLPRALLPPTNRPTSGAGLRYRLHLLL
jgi:4-nitrophenyl phosphatase/NagD protein